MKDCCRLRQGPRPVVQGQPVRVRRAAAASLPRPDRHRLLNLSRAQAGAACSRMCETDYTYLFNHRPSDRIGAPPAKICGRRVCQNAIEPASGIRAGWIGGQKVAGLATMHRVAGTECPAMACGCDALANVQINRSKPCSRRAKDTSPSLHAHGRGRGRCQGGEKRSQ
jgi:hypothetical protein